MREFLDRLGPITHEGRITEILRDEAALVRFVRAQHMAPTPIVAADSVNKQRDRQRAAKQARKANRHV